MDEYIFWMIYFTLSRRYLPEQPHHEQSTTAGESSHGQAAASSNRPQSSLAMDRQQHTQVLLGQFDISTGHLKQLQLMLHGFALQRFVCIALLSRVVV